MAEGDTNREIVIIRRGGHDEAVEHHGGVWKIAFADFMTAMMAFFLVMWLISANDKTRATIARYFNPVRLVDSTTQPAGLHDVTKQEPGSTAPPDPSRLPHKGEAKKAASPPPPAAAKDRAPRSETPTQEEKRLDKALRDNPLAALTEIASSNGQGERSGGKSPSGTPVIGRRGGDAFRDPFAPPTSGSPAARSTDDEAIEAMAKQVTEPDALPAEADRGSAQNASTKTENQPKADRPSGIDKAPRLDATVEAPAEAKSDLEAKNDVHAKSDLETKSDPETKSDVEARHDNEVKTLLSALQDGPRGEPGPKVDIHRTPDGLVLSLTDTTDFSMFANGSAVPAREVVLMMDRVAAVLKTKPGAVVVRGFTDNKPYRGGRYDNWHLSLDRAQVAHYMLVHGGLDDARIAHVEGYADRGRKPGVDAGSPLNRRIEILLKDAG